MERGTMLLPTGNLYAYEGRDVGRRMFLKGMGAIACLGFVPILQACDNALSQKGKGKNMVSTVPAAHAMRPQIDASAPAKTQTATFALG
jgi:hypothetical protein